MNSIIKADKEGKIIIGICNGFQILTESRLLPGSLLINESVKFISKRVLLKTMTTNSPFTSKLKSNELVNMPIAHKQGNYSASNEIINELNEEDRIVFKYINNPNGSLK